MESYTTQTQEGETIVKMAGHGDMYAYRYKYAHSGVMVGLLDRYSPLSGALVHVRPSNDCSQFEGVVAPGFEASEDVLRVSLVHRWARENPSIVTGFKSAIIEFLESASKSDINITAAFANLLGPFATIISRLLGGETDITQFLVAGAFLLQQGKAFVPEKEIASYDGIELHKANYKFHKTYLTITDTEGYTSIDKAISEAKVLSLFPGLVGIADDPLQDNSGKIIYFASNMIGGDVRYILEKGGAHYDAFVNACVAAIITEALQEQYRRFSTSADGWLDRQLEYVPSYDAIKTAFGFESLIRRYKLKTAYSFIEDSVYNLMMSLSGPHELNQDIVYGTNNRDLEYDTLGRLKTATWFLMMSLTNVCDNPQVMQQSVKQNIYQGVVHIANVINLVTLGGFNSLLQSLQSITSADNTGVQALTYHLYDSIASINRSVCNYASKIDNPYLVVTTATTQASASDKNTIDKLLTDITIRLGEALKAENVKTDGIKTFKDYIQAVIQAKQNDPKAKDVLPRLTTRISFEQLIGKAGASLNMLSANEHSFNEFLRKFGVLIALPPGMYHFIHNYKALLAALYQGKPCLTLAAPVDELESKVYRISYYAFYFRNINRNAIASDAITPALQYMIPESVSFVNSEHFTYTSLPKQYGRFGTPLWTRTEVVMTPFNDWIFFFGNFVGLEVFADALKIPEFIATSSESAGSGSGSSISSTTGTMTQNLSNNTSEQTANPPLQASKR